MHSFLIQIFMPLERILCAGHAGRAGRAGLMYDLQDFILSAIGCGKIYSRNIVYIIGY